MKPDHSWWACCCISPMVCSFCPSNTSPLSIWRSANMLPQTCAYMSIQPMRKKTSVGRDVTCWHLPKHLDSWIPSPHWAVHGNQSHSSVINAMLLRKTMHVEALCCWASLILAYMHTRHYWFVFQGCRVHIWEETDTIQSWCVCLKQVKDGSAVCVCVCACIEMNTEVCVLSGD